MRRARLDAAERALALAGDIAAKPGQHRHFAIDGAMPLHLTQVDLGVRAAMDQLLGEAPADGPRADAKVAGDFADAAA
jgi:hypothetical protein